MFVLEFSYPTHANTPFTKSDDPRIVDLGFFFPLFFLLLSKNRIVMKLPFKLIARVYAIGLETPQLCNTVNCQGNRITRMTLWIIIIVRSEITSQDRWDVIRSLHLQSYRFPVIVKEERPRDKVNPINCIQSGNPFCDKNWCLDYSRFNDSSFHPRIFWCSWKLVKCSVYSYATYLNQFRTGKRFIRYSWLYPVGGESCAGFEWQKFWWFINCNQHIQRIPAWGGTVAPYGKAEDIFDPSSCDKKLLIDSSRSYLDLVLPRGRKSWESVDKVERICGDLKFSTRAEIHVTSTWQISIPNVTMTITTGNTYLFVYSYNATAGPQRAVVSWCIRAA